MESLLEIERIYEELTKQTEEILNNNFPMDSRGFLRGEDATIVKENDKKISNLADEYLDIYNSLPIDKREKIRL